MNRAGVLRWYPASWRRRYGDELLGLLEDTYGAGPLPMAEHWSLVRRGLVERLHRAGLAAGEPPAEQVRGGALLVLWAWVPVVLGGAAFAKLAEHWPASVPGPRQGLPASAYGLVVGAALGALLLLGAGAVVALPALGRAVRAGDLTGTGRRLALASALSALTLAAGAGLVFWAHRLSWAARNGRSAAYTLAGLGLVTLVAATLVAGAAAGSAVGRRLDLSPRALRAEGWCALGLAAMAFLVALGAALWSSALVRLAPGFLSPSPALVACGLLLAGGLALALAGAARVAFALRRVTP